MFKLTILFSVTIVGIVASSVFIPFPWSAITSSLIALIFVFLIYTCIE